MKRRHFLQTGVAAGSLWLTPSLFAELLTETPRMTEGPFYPDKLPLDRDNDLLIVGESMDPGLGTVTHLTGRVLSASGEPVRNAIVEIWQCDNNGAYLHAGTDNDESRDKNFQGYGQFQTDKDGNYRFRTIKPVPYPGRTPHIHFGVSRRGQRVLTTQLFVKGDPGNDRDGILKAIKDPKALENVLGDFQPVPDSKIGELAVNFDLILGLTPNEDEHGHDDGSHGVGKSDRESGSLFGPRGPGGRPRN
ncbi:intradiol ring-cleavage dioxygenase [Planctomicrobium sp. SH668]|uniref:dioxygenase family protein n=1 Tax=Planctomicrobium sp. SH668 TaxID=3448126 RepID=UPI003F5C996F